MRLTKKLQTFIDRYLSNKYGGLKLPNLEMVRILSPKRPHRYRSRDLGMELPRTEMLRRNERDLETTSREGDEESWMDLVRSWRLLETETDGETSRWPYVPTKEFSNGL